MINFIFLIAPPSYSEAIQEAQLPYNPDAGEQDYTTLETFHSYDNQI